MLDSFNRKITYLRVSVTDRCNLRCTYCMSETGIPLKSHGDIISYEQIIQVVEVATELGIKKVRITGGEPLVRKGMVYLVKELRSISGIEELTLTTNGILLNTMAVSLKKAGLDRINISLDTLNPQKYTKLTRGGDIARVHLGMEAIIKAGFINTKINMVLIPGINDDEVEAMKAFCQGKGFTLQRINQYSLSNINSIDRAFTAERPLDCQQCNRIRLTADGKLKPCLFSDLEIPLDFNNLRESLTAAIKGKPEKGSCNNSRSNWQIGG